MTTSSPTPQEILQQAQTLAPQIKAWRRQIHRHPELSFNEHRTAALVNKTLLDLGLKTETEVAKTGVVATIGNGNGPIVGLRADMDALPIKEQNGTDFDSLQPGLMHACGHDAHTAMLLGAATILKNLSEQGKLPGTVRLLFQPSEEAQDAEGKSGGMRMVEEGALNGLSAVFGLHVDTTLNAGQIATRPGPMMAGADTFHLTLRGRAGHAARPHQAIDTIVLAANVIQTIQQIISRRLDPIEQGVITVGTINGGSKDNIIADTVTMSGTIRSFTLHSRQFLHEQLAQACQIVEPLGGKFDLHIQPGYPPLINTPQAAELALTTMGALLGEEAVSVIPPMMSAEDFSFMAQQAPGAFLRLGVHNPNWEQHYPVHTPTFRLDETALPVGSAALVATALAWMEQA